MKKTFQKAELNVIRIKDDIIATSGDTITGYSVTNAFGETPDEVEW